MVQSCGYEHFIVKGACSKNGVKIKSWKKVLTKECLCSKVSVEKHNQDLTWFKILRLADSVFTFCISLSCIISDSEEVIFSL